MSRNIAAFTSEGSSYPPYVSVNTGFNEPDKIEITVRSKAKEDGSCGDTSIIAMDAETFRSLVNEMHSFCLFKLLTAGGVTPHRNIGILNTLEY